MILADNYRKPLLGALLIHILVIGLLLLDIELPSAPLTVQTRVNKPIINAVAVDQEKVQTEINRIKQQRQAKLDAQQARQQRLQEQALAAQRQKQEAAEKFKALQQKIKQAEQQRIAQQKAAAKRLARIKQQRLQAQRALKAAKQKQVLAKRKQQQLVAAKQRAAALAAKNNAAAKVKQAQLRSQVDKYKALIVNAVRQKWLIPNVNKHLATQLQIRLAPTGMVLRVVVLKSSGDPALDRSVESAVYKASPLPVPKDPDLFNYFRVINWTFRPEQILG